MKLSKKYTGVYQNKLQNGDISYYITYKDTDGRKIREKIGTKKGGITELYCSNIRFDRINLIRLGESPRKKKESILFDKIANEVLVIKNRREYDSNYRKHIKTYLGNQNIFDITTANIEKIKNEKKEELAPSTVNGLISLVKVIFTYAVDKKYIKDNPSSEVKFIKKIDNKRIRYLNTNEIGTLLEATKGNKKIYLFVKLALSTGARMNTVLSIKKKDIDLELMSITLKDFKNESSYSGFILDNELTELLKEAIKNLKEDEYIFSADNGKTKIHHSTIQKPLQNTLNFLFNNEIPLNDSKNRVVLHTLRHTFASHLAINGTSIYVIQRLMNHSDIQMSMRYAKLAPDSGKIEVKGLYQ